ncbi:hypothetical protein C1I89_02155 [Achromobacter pulmonis]|uniref:Uncharacterized protein n=1 Tax=Achromobacter pulmonis TaxID=1389932 RepID=A0A2N8KP55_9BURK|nr:hypothetical protein C1I89_02155 [Achromobacter pulmonis]
MAPPVLAWFMMVSSPAAGPRGVFLMVYIADACFAVIVPPAPRRLKREFTIRTLFAAAGRARARPARQNAAT